MSIIINQLWFLISHPFGKLALLAFILLSDLESMFFNTKGEHLLRERWLAPLLSLILYNDSIFVNHHSRVLPGIPWKPLVKALPEKFSHLTNLFLRLAPQLALGK